MPQARPQGPVVQKKFIRGLISQTTALDFPEDACTDIDNCVINRTGLVERRLGFQFEDDHVSPTVTAVDGEAFTEFAWNNPAGIDTLGFEVQQQGATLHFYDYSTSPSLSPNKKTFTIDLNDYAAGGQDPTSYPCQYTIVDSKLVVVNAVCDPIYIVYSVSSDDITTTAITLRRRDFEGVDDGLTLNQRVTKTVAGLIADNPEHYYNLLNQGWYVADALAQWDSARTDVPSNADTVPAYRASETDAFDNARVTANSPGTTAAAKGHFIVDVFDIDRPTAITDDGLAGIGVVTSETQISQSAGTAFGNMTFGGTGLSLVFDGTTSHALAGQAQGPAALTNYAGKDFTASTPFRITHAVAYGSNDQGFVNGWASGVTLTLYGKTGGTPPSTSSDGVSLGTLSFTDGADESAGRTITSSDTTTYYNYAWIEISSGTAIAKNLIELQLFTVGSTSTPGGLEPFTTAARPSTVCQMGGRLFYSGVNDGTIGNNIYFTQILQGVSQYGYCYQQNDPTSEVLSDLLPDDGGVIRIPEMGQVLKIVSMKSSVAVIANNGVWIISGAKGQGFFAATEYRIDKISTIPTVAALSVVDNEGVPIWWTESGIYTVQYDPNYDSYILKDLTIQTIRAYLLEIPSLNRRYVKGTYDVQAGMLYWVFNDSESLTTAERYVYNKVLCMDVYTQACVPWTNEGANSIRGLIYLQDKAHSAPARVKYVTTTGSEALTFSEVSGTDYTDWDTDFTSYFISGYHLDGDFIRFFMPLYVIVYLDTVADSSCFMQGLFDFTTSASSGKWSTAQQLYNSALLYRAANYRRLKVRGKGRAMQLKFTSEAGKPFTVLGWALEETANPRI